MSYYEVIVKGHLNGKRFLRFEGLGISLLSSGNTRIRGEVDQATLHALLGYIRDLGLTLLSVKRI